ncbi:hypothetical protein Back11_34750 [Paenibacillus baekrokdamisoli]|uniref:Uncharacterized protein n=1 Tax=Paenibacillus baekrokdamisoli TaxID=1712516 RepID=A0A3G9ITC7_9BACL|nr:hypothetical protein [Paenibacillus baekrokdamisoli]MBB3070931.1 hypothetical protein [Paenibacillus baekrokdamisoli]BBH22130.1 hypothetical protein Back11_34750 [Paenibacillus baekrokdamisoli]
MKAAWVDETGGDAPITGDKVLFTLVFKLKEGFASGSKAYR